MNHSLLSSNFSGRTLNSLDTLSDVRIKAFMLLFLLRLCLSQTKPSLLGASSAVVNNV
jgi:hypothetical protein